MAVAGPSSGDGGTAPEPGRITIRASSNARMGTRAPGGASHDLERGTRLDDLRISVGNWGGASPEAVVRLATGSARIAGAPRPSRQALSEESFKNRPASAEEKPKRRCMKGR
jgi:hypothetical protein